MKHLIGVLFAALAVLSVQAKTWECSTVAEVTNAFANLASSDIVKVAPGTYDFSGIVGTVETYTKDSVDYAITNHIVVTKASGYELVGDTDGHWDDEVIFRGDGRFLTFTPYWTCKIRNITFENFDGGSYPGLDSNANDNSIAGSLGGAISFRQGDASAVVSNCVFRNCRAWKGGAVYGGGINDCLFLTNAAVAVGGAACRCRMLVTSRFVGNRAPSASSCYIDQTDVSPRGCWFVDNVHDYDGTLRFNDSFPRVTTCVFVGNSAVATTHPSGDVNNLGGGAMRITTAGNLIDCVFSNNWARIAGGAVYLQGGTTHLEDCRFVGNHTSETSGGRGGAVASLYCGTPTFTNCTFEANWVTNNVYGGAVAIWYSSEFHGCRFLYNTNWSSKGGAIAGGCNGGAALCTTVIKCAFSNNVANGMGGAIYHNHNDQPANYNGRIFGSTFVRNGAQVGGALYNCTASNCTFIAQHPAYYLGGKSAHQEHGGKTARRCQLIDCDSSGSGDFCDCALVRCRIHDYTYVSDAGSLGCVFHGSANYVTNCLFENITTSSRGFSFYYSDAGSKTNEFVNCTFADITLNNNAALFTGKGSTEKRKVAGKFVNCILSNIHRVIGTKVDISGVNITDASAVSLSNTLYGVDAGTLTGGTPETAWRDLGGNIVSAEPKFVAGNPRYPEAPYYSLRNFSPARGKGDATVFTANDVDLAGQARLRDGKVDLGCYQCWLNPIGSLLLIR